MNDVMKLSRGEGVKMLNSSFDNTCSMTLEVELDRAETLTKKLLDIDGLTLDS